MVLPGILPQQNPIAASKRRFKVIRAGRRFGKDVVDLRCAIYGHGPAVCPGKPFCPRAPHSDEEPCFRGLLDGFDVVWVGPDYPQASLFWRQEIEPRFQEGDNVRLNRSEHTVSLTGLGTLYIRSAETIDTIRGVGKFLGGVIVNEAAHLDLEYALRTVIRPALMDNRGWLILSSTTNAALDGNAEKRTPSYFNLICEEIRDHSERRDPSEWESFHGTAFDNPILDPHEVQGLINEYQPDSVPLKEEVYAELLEARVGLVFSEWNESLHVLPKDAHVPNGWRWAASLDFGFRKPGCFLLYANGPDDDIIVSDELYFKEKYARDAGRECAKLALRAGGAVEYVACDEAMDQRTGAGFGPTILEEFQAGWDAVFGGIGRGPRCIKVAKGDGSRRHRVQVTHHWLAWRTDEDGQVPPLFQPRLKVHPRCVNLIRTLPKLPYDPLKQEDVDTNAEDHAYDSLSYYLMSRPAKPPAWAKPGDENTHPGFDYGHRARKKKPYEQRDEQLAQRGFLPRGPMVDAE